MFAGLWLVDVLVPDIVPFIDEILLTIVTLLLASLRRKEPVPDGPEKSVPGANP